MIAKVWLRVVLMALLLATLFLPDTAAAAPTEITSLRTENIKTYDLGNGLRRLRVSMGAVHYKNDYTDSYEGWKDIDLTWEGNKITKAPYELTRNGYVLTIRNKKTGEISTIELLGVGGIKPTKTLDTTTLSDIALDTDLEVVAENGAVKFTRVLKSNQAPTEAKFRITGNFKVNASDENGELPVVFTLKDGILTETLSPDRTVKYPVRIDPTWQVGGGEGSTDDSTRNTVTTDFFSTTYSALYLGYSSPSYPSRGSAARFLNVAI
ncbi:hypothetical protein LCGC14_3036950, partial [marine sediment metagenome]